MDITTVLAENWLLVVAVYVCVQLPKMVFPSLATAKWSQRLMPIFPVMVGVIAAVLGAAKGVTTMADKVLLGMVAGFTGGHLYKVGKTSLLGRGLGLGTETVSDVGEETAPSGAEPAVVSDDKPEEKDAAS